MKKLTRLLFITVAAVMLLSASGCHYLFPDGIWGDNSWDGGQTQYYTAADKPFAAFDNVSEYIISNSYGNNVFNPSTITENNGKYYLPVGMGEIIDALNEHHKLNNNGEDIPFIKSGMLGFDADAGSYYLTERAEASTSTSVAGEVINLIQAAYSSGYNVSVHSMSANVSVYSSSEVTTAQVEYTEPEDGDLYFSESATGLDISVRNNRKPGFFSLFDNEKPIDVTVYLPENTNYNLLIEVEAGNLDVKDLTGAKLDLETDAGNITVGFSFFDSFEAHTEAGNIELEAYSLNAEISTEVGDVRGRIHADKLDVEVSVGDVILEAKGFSVNGSTPEGPSRIDIETAIGMINLLVSSDCMGDTYTVEASAVLGSEDVAPFGYGNRRIVASTSIGSISIYFRY